MTTAVANPRAFAVWFKDLERWDVAFFRRLSWAWPPTVLRPLGEALVREVREVDPKGDKSAVPIIEKISFGGDVSLSDTAGRMKYKGRLFWAEPGDLIYSKIRVKQGSLAVVPPSIPQLAVSAEYPVYRIRPAVADGEYLVLVLTSSAFQNFLVGLSHGGSTKTRLHPTEFERLTVPLPALPVQRAIVRRWQEAQDRIGKAQARADALEVRIGREILRRLGIQTAEADTLPKAFAVYWKDLERWGVLSNRRARAGASLNTGKYPVTLGKDCIAEVKHGCSASPSPKPTGLDVLKISAVTRGHLRPDERKCAFDRPRFRSEFDLRGGDVLLCRTNGTLGLVGMSALVEADVSDLIFPDKVIRVRTESKLLPAFFWIVTQTPVIRAQIEAAARTAVGNYAIGTDDIWALRLPLPPLAVQHRITDMVKEKRAEVARERQAAAKLSAEVAEEVEEMILGARPVRLSRTRGHSDAGPCHTLPPNVVT